MAHFVLSKVQSYGFLGPFYYPMSILGIDIGGSKTAVSRLTRDGQVEEFARFTTGDYQSTLDRVAEEARAAGIPPSPLIGISCGGPLDAKRGLILSPPNLPGWDEVPICEDLRRRLGGPAYLMNDANACCLAEWWFGAGRGCSHLVFLTSGTGMGAGLILNGRLYEGATGDAGEVGHIRLARTGPVGYGKAGSFEGFCSGGGIARLGALRRREPAEAVPSAKQIAEAAERGDPFSRKLLREAGARLGEALAVIVDVLNPQRIVIGGFYPLSRALLEPAMRKTLAKEALAGPLAACEILPAQLGRTIGSYGAISAVLHGAGIDPASVAPGRQRIVGS